MTLSYSQEETNMMKMTKREYDYKLKKIQEQNIQIEMRNKLREERGKFKTTNKKIKTSNLVLFATIVAIILYTIACLYIQYNIGMEVSSTLTTLWYSFWTVEIVALTGIKVTKVIRDAKDKDDDMVDNINEECNNAKG